ncbi:hypothetical protein [Paenibacillus sp. sgz5001063]|uniref:hypothetical protein n=1 Tax=Paenibacillus sp. sgz5001063 TaxID=3242474 RepID=UPI0036D31E0A
MSRIQANLATPAVTIWYRAFRDRRAFIEDKDVSGVHWKDEIVRLPTKQLKRGLGYVYGNCGGNAGAGPADH